MRIERIEAVRVRIPLHHPYVYARGAQTAFDNIVVRVETDDGIIGYGESAPHFGLPSQYIDDVVRSIEGKVGQSLLGIDPFDVEVLVARALEVGEGNPDCVSGIDMAVWDIMGKHLGQPIFRLIGGLCQDPIAVDYTLSAGTPDEMADVAAEVHQQGFQGVVVKVTGESIDLGIEQSRRVRSVLPPDCTVRVDCNEGFKRDEALQFLKGIADLDIELVEQPVPRRDFEGLRRCRQFGIPVCVDESLITLDDALALVREDACDIMNIKVPRVGGLLLAKRMAAIGESAGMGIVVGGRTSTEISRAASRHFAASTLGARGRKHEGPGPASQALSDDVVSWRTTKPATGKAGGYVEVEKGPGLGVQVLWNKVEHYSVPCSR
jgi:muconate cycloisomerase